jgi:hypothetical protein
VRHLTPQGRLGRLAYPGGELELENTPESDENGSMTFCGTAVFKANQAKASLEIQTKPSPKE